MRTIALLIPLIAALLSMICTIVSMLAQVSPWRLPNPRRKVAYNVHFDAFIEQRTESDVPDIGRLAKLIVQRPDGVTVSRPSVAMIRISNDGGLDIEKGDWIRQIEFAFDGRQVEGVEVSDEFSGRVLREAIVAHAARAVVEAAVEATVEAAEGIAESAVTYAGEGSAEGSAEGGAGAADDRRKLQLPPITLNKKDRFRVLVLLSGNRENPGRKGSGVSGSALLAKGVPGGGLVRESGPGAAATRTFWWAGISVACIAAAVIAAFAIRPVTAVPMNADCVAGRLVAEGSTAFRNSFTALSRRYQDSCHRASIAVDTSVQGSIGAAQDLENVGGTRLLLSDGLLSEVDYPHLLPHAAAIVIFSIVVNRQSGITSLTPAQVRGIWAGDYQNWDKLGGSNLRIAIVARTEGSGTRVTFDGKILGTASEPDASSQNCRRNDIIPDASVIRCAEPTTGEVLQTVNATPGAIGYAETGTANAASQSQYPQVSLIQLGGQAATSQAVQHGSYGFWNVEYLYTYNKPRARSLPQAFLNYVDSDAGVRSLQRSGDIPCSLTPLCSQPFAPTGGTRS